MIPEAQLRRFVRTACAVQQANTCVQRAYSRFIDSRVLYRITNDPSLAFERLIARRRIEWELAHDRLHRATERFRVLRIQADKRIRAVVP